MTAAEKALLAQRNLKYTLPTQPKHYAKVREWFQVEVQGVSYLLLKATVPLMKRW